MSCKSNPRSLLTASAFLGLCSVLLFSACGAQDRGELPATVPGQAITGGPPLLQMQFYVRYLEASQQVHAEVSLRGDTSAIVLKNRIQFQGEPMQAKKLPAVGYQYRLTLDKVKPDSVYTFQFADAKGQTRTYRVSMPLSLPPRLASKNGLSKDKGGALLWEGSPLTAQDGWILNLSDSKGNPITINHSGLTEQPNILPIPASMIAPLQTGKGALLLTRKRATVEESEGTRIIRHAEYYFHEQPIQITP